MLHGSQIFSNIALETVGGIHTKNTHCWITESKTWSTFSNTVQYLR